MTERVFVEDATRALSCSHTEATRCVRGPGRLRHWLFVPQLPSGYPVDIVKIDQSFIAHLTEDTSSHAIVAKTIELAHLLNLIVVCEGVETIEQYRQISALRSDFCQGFYFSRPMTAGSLDDTAGVATSPWTIAA